MRTIYYLTLICGALLLTNCNKEKKLMKNIIGNWVITSSEKSTIQSDGNVSVYEKVEATTNKLVIYEDPASEENLMYDLFFVDLNNDTIKKTNKLVTDERNRRIILQKALSDSTTMCDLAWTIESEKKNSQTWSIYGVDSTFYYTTNTHNPGAATNWLMWRIKLERE
jgi:hypothetical protein